MHELSDLSEVSDRFESIRIRFDPTFKLDPNLELDVARGLNVDIGGFVAWKMNQNKIVT